MRSPHPVLTALTLLLAGTVLAGCANTPSSPELTTPDVLYLNELQHGDVDSHPIDIRIARGRDTCVSLDKRATVPGAVNALRRDFFPDQASVVVIAAIRHYCPHHHGLLTVPQRG
ncbi:MULTISPECIES: DUF732 domain-containing protein [unclassified Crossiella]|uniref:DUF732 domain-containing protein n=1 Tax=unclassified Crossiella TaxID=2620835 RepID=UPI001FFE960E|nr:MULTISPECIES: DUF732 domain-containing protein [unclassified Crossiella]MCK2240006.1 DUF732 domain-containing protein [Crossiella sp. S99.2]MCK2252714.1 DUF732 domain-containing protein [Crossiella sp. S99.1]